MIQKTYINLVKLEEITLNLFRLSFTDFVIYKYRLPVQFLPVTLLGIRLLPLSVSSSFILQTFPFSYELEAILLSHALVHLF